MNTLLALLVLTTAWASDVRIEAEDAELIGVTVDTTRAGYSGTGYVTGFDEPGDSLRFEVETERGVHELRLAYAVTGRFVPFELWVDGTRVAGSAFGTNGAFAERLGAELWLPEGRHTIVVKGAFDVDYLHVVRQTYPPPPTPPEVLSDADATPATRALFRFLLDQYGTHVLSGQQDLGEIAYIENVTGRTPAIGAFDLIDYSPSRVACGTNPRPGTDGWIDWAGERGIVTMMWHWNAPTDLIDDNCNINDNAEGQEWWSGFYTRATTFNFAEALADTTSERYALILRDIDAIAVQLQKFAAADVPLLWRPLHEADGGWFWWGTQGAEPFIELWRLVYDRLVHHHEIHNLIWVYTHDDPAWYPGDDYVDVVSRDVYASDPNALLASDWEAAQNLFAGEKLVTLSESGTLPHPEVFTDFGIWWSWFVIWNGAFLHDIPADFLTDVYTSEVVLTRDELPDWRSLYSVGTEAVAGLAPAFDLYPNPSAGRSVLSVTLPAAADVRVEVYDLLGRRVRTYALGHRAAGAFETAVEAGDAAGVYVVRVTAGDFVAHRTLVVAGL